jgi:hypothetical protein
MPMCSYQHGLVVYSLRGSRMARYRYSQMLLNVAYIFLLRFALGVRPLLAIGFFKVVGSLALACLLAFVVVHSAHIRRLLVSCLKAFSLCFFPLAIGSRIFIDSTDSRRGFNEPGLRLLFQRPPPFLSL